MFMCFEKKLLIEYFSQLKITGNMDAIAHWVMWVMNFIYTFLGLDTATGKALIFFRITEQ